jgi:hypothetical protein
MWQVNPFFIGAFIGVFLGAGLITFVADYAGSQRLSTACKQVEPSATWDGSKCVVTTTRKAGAK